jgi:hypothetical protein
MMMFFGTLVEDLAAVVQNWAIFFLFFLFFFVNPIYRAKMIIYVTRSTGSRGFTIRSWLTLGDC